MERQIPNTLQEKLDDERTTLYHQLWAIEDAITALTKGSVSSYSLGNRSVSYQNLDELRTLQHEIESRIEEIEAILCHRSPRNVTTNTMLTGGLFLPRR